ncbi:MAG: tRNA pseudouridine(55) synthase TruB [Pseudomonadota bacterium]
MNVHGILLLNKPAGMTSNRALQIAKRAIGAKKAGHTGSLDPAATGMLPLCFGEATKVCAYLLDADKTYRVTAKLGVQTDTGDADGQPVGEASVPDLSEDDWRKILEPFLGHSNQIPPMYSALKKDGRRLYELARKGETVEREPRPIRIDAIELLECHGTRLVFRVSCSKGTYVRSLVEDIAAAAGTVAHTARLHRERVANFDAGAMVDLDEVKRLAAEPEGFPLSQLVAPDAALAAFPAVNLAAEPGLRFSGGQAIADIGEAEPGLVRVYAPQKQFLGIGALSAARILAPKRVFLMDEKNR